MKRHLVTLKEYDFLTMGNSFSGNYQLRGVGPLEFSSTNFLTETCVFSGRTHTLATTAMSRKLTVDI